MSGPAILSLDWVLRGGTVALLLLTAGGLWRHHGRLVAARLGALFTALSLLMLFRTTSVPLAHDSERAGRSRPGRA